MHVDDVDTMIDYLLLCARKRDWHGVSDAANDLRVLEAKEEQRLGDACQYILNKPE